MTGSTMSNYAQAMERIEDLLKEIPVDELRRDVALAESLEGKRSLPSLPSGRSFKKHTRRARAWLNFIDELRAIELGDPIIK